MIGSIPAETEAEKKRVERLQQMTPEKIAPLVVYLASDRAQGISGQIFSVRNNEIFLFNQPRPIRVDPSLRRLDAGGDRCSSSRARSVLLHAARALRRRVLLGPDLSRGLVMPIVYDKLLALKIPEAEHTYTDKDTMLYALGVGLGHDPMNRDELAFVYEKDLKPLPTLAAVLGYPGFWIRDLDTGIDWVRLVNGEQGVTLHRAARTARHRDRRTRILEVVDKGTGKGALVYTERKVTDKASGELIATVTQTTFCRADGGFGGPPRESAAAA